MSSKIQKVSYTISDTDGSFKDHYFKSLSNIPEYYEQHQNNDKKKNLNTIQRLWFLSWHVQSLVYYLEQKIIKQKIELLQCDDRNIILF